MSEWRIGIDIGSTCAKTVVLDEDKHILQAFLYPTGWSSVETAEMIRQELVRRGINIDAGHAKITATGYGRNSVSYAGRVVTEITCHGRGACFLHHAEDLTIIDIGGQDTKIIQTMGGAVADFLMNDKCSAGTGRFLEIMANILSVTPEDLCTLAERGGNTTISSMCTVFAESEVISLIGKGETRENIAFAIVNSIVDKVTTQAGRLLPSQGSVCLTGGLCAFPYVKQSLETALQRPVLTSPYGQYAGAIGAALASEKSGGKPNNTRG